METMSTLERRLLALKKVMHPSEIEQAYLFKKLLVFLQEKDAVRFHAKIIKSANPVITIKPKICPFLTVKIEDIGSSATGEYRLNVSVYESEKYSGITLERFVSMEVFASAYRNTGEFGDGASFALELFEREETYAIFLKPVYLSDYNEISLYLNKFCGACKKISEEQTK